MLLLQAPARALITLHRRGVLKPHLLERIKEYEEGTTESEQEAWVTSLLELASDLVETGRSEVRVLVEFRPPGYTKGPMDAVLVGIHPESGHDSYLPVELKRWTNASEDPRKPGNYHVGYPTSTKHPSQQVKPFCDFLTSEDGPLKGIQVEMAGAVYLHNADQADVSELLDHKSTRTIRTVHFTGDRREDLRQLIRTQFAPTPGESAVARLLDSLTSKEDSLLKVLQNNPLADVLFHPHGEDHVFTLRGNQLAAKSDILAAVERAKSHGDKAVFIITGGAGTGKTAIAVELMRAVQPPKARLANGAEAFMGLLKEHLGKTDPVLFEALAYFNEFVHASPDGLTLIVCDEAHRLRSKSDDLYRADRRGDRPQVDELIDAARVSVFLLDEKQSVRGNEVGRLSTIRRAAKERGIKAAEFDLRRQWRCGGSDSYIKWVHDLLGLSNNDPWKWLPDGMIHVQVADTPSALEHVILHEGNNGSTARMVAGYCWPWSKPRKDKTLVPDVEIGDWARPWNVNGTLKSYANGAPPKNLWSVRREGIHQVGCVYTAQGMEWDWCGVILGKDYVWRDGKWIAQPSASHDSKVKSLDSDRFHECIRNVYHVLLTRARRGVVLYSDDPETQTYLKEHVPSFDIQGLRPPVDLDGH
ncbi:DNA/RNA helicase domain-containing protein [Streptomyces sp. NPDC057694]|uniref:DNA/RNA helicase domain-containing protein n=1 Tax=Streptomyces sp. NPDC057694 TaxID=3346216 RepID=UPI0036BD07D9